MIILKENKLKNDHGCPGLIVSCQRKNETDQFNVFMKNLRLNLLS